MTSSTETNEALNDYAQYQKAQEELADIETARVRGWGYFVGAYFTGPIWPAVIATRTKKWTPFWAGLGLGVLKAIVSYIHFIRKSNICGRKRWRAYSLNQKPAMHLLSTINGRDFLVALPGPALLEIDKFSGDESHCYRQAEKEIRSQPAPTQERDLGSYQKTLNEIIDKYRKLAEDHKHYPEPGAASSEQPGSGGGAASSRP